VGAVDIGLGRVDRVLRFGDLRVLQCFAGFQILDRGFGAGELSPGLLQPGAVVVILDLDQQIAFLHLLKIINWGPVHITFDFGAEGCDVAAGISVVRSLTNANANPAVPSGDEQCDNHASEQQDCNGDRNAAEQPKNSLSPAGSVT
jgi:hypothetical protein